MGRVSTTAPIVLSWTLKAALLLTVSGCSIAPRTIDVARLGPANRVEVQECGHPVFERSIDPGSAEERAVTSWLQSHNSGWQPTFATYAPVRAVRGDNFNLIFHKTACILNYRVNDKGGWVQVSRPIEPGEAIPAVFARVP